MSDVQSKIDSYFSQVYQIIYEEYIIALQRIGEESVRIARDRSESESWRNRTGNLRSSIGYSIYEKGKTTIRSAFPVVKDGKEGPSVSNAILDTLASKYSDTIALVVIAGMEYAEYVEAMEGKDVLATAKTHAMAEADSKLEVAYKKAVMRINNIRL